MILLCSIEQLNSSILAIEIRCFTSHKGASDVPRSPTVEAITMQKPHYENLMATKEAVWGWSLL